MAHLNPVCVCLHAVSSLNPEDSLRMHNQTFTSSFNHPCVPLSLIAALAASLHLNPLRKNKITTFPGHIPGGKW